MSILTGPEIKRLAEGNFGVKGERITIRPFTPAHCGANSYDVRLGDSLRCYSRDPLDARPFMLDPFASNMTHEVTPDADEHGPFWVLEPGRLYLGTTREYTETHGLVPVLYGRSSIGRLGLFIHVTAGFGDDGFCGHWTLELVAVHAVKVRPGMQIGQLIYHTLSGDRQPYRGRYQDQPAAPVASRFHEGTK
jgi:dCTP deaminase